MNRIALIIAALSLVLPALVPARASDRDPPTAPLAPGDRVFDFTLRDLENREHRLGRAFLPRTDGPAVRAVVLVFNGLGCPIAELYAPRVEALHRRYEADGVRVLGVNANRYDTVEALRSFASRFRLTFPVLKDHHNRVADALGATRTTEVFLIDSELRLRYRGRFDDQYTLGERSVGLRKEKPEASYLADAIDALLAGKPVARPATEAMGCVISRVREVRDATSVTFHEHVEPIVQEYCQSCHREGEIGPFPLLSYEDVAGWSGMIREVVVNRRMPPWHADPAHSTFQNDRSLPAEKLETVVRWVDNGAPRGDPAKAPPPRAFASGWQMGEPDAVFELSEAFDVPAAGTVPYRYAMVETDFAEDRWVVASEVRPGDPGVVHHILVFVADPENPREWRRESGGGTRGYFAVMVPGERPTAYPEGLAKRLPAGATLVFQIHYTPNGRATHDRSRVGLRFARGPVEREVSTRSAYNRRDLRIPAGAARHEVTASYRFHRPAQLLSFLPHMHLRGESFRYELLLPATARLSRPPRMADLAEWRDQLDYNAETGELTLSGRMPPELYEALWAMYDSQEDRSQIICLTRDPLRAVLLNVPRYDFGWQNTYRLAEPILVPRGAVLRSVAHFNNSRTNPVLTEDMVNQEVRWGEQTWEEMLIGYFDLVFLEESDGTPIPEVSRGF